MSIKFDDDKNWRAPTEEERRLVESVAPERIARAKTNVIALTLGIGSPSVLLVILALLENLAWLGSLIVIVPLGGICIFMFYRIYINLKTCIASGKYTVQSGTVIRKSVHIKCGKSNYIHFRSDSGNERKVILPSKYYLMFSVGDRCLLMKVEPKGPGYDDPIECIKP